MKRFITFLPLGFCVLILLLDLIGLFLFPEAGIPGFYIWSASYVLMAGFCLHQLVWILRQAVQGRAALTLLALLTVIAVVLAQTTNPANLSGETTQQVGCVFFRMRKTGNFGFLSDCFFEYPIRQYYPSAIFSMLLGHSQLALHLGASFYFILGSVIFAAGFLKYYQRLNFADPLCAALLALPFHSHFFNTFMMHYEQSVFPLCFTMLCCGVFYLYLAERSVLLLGILGLSVYYTVHSYTPSLAFVVLTACVLLSLPEMLSPAARDLRRAVTVVFLLICFEIGVSFAIRGDFRIKGESTSLTDVYGYLTRGLEHFLFGTKGVILYTIPTYALYVLAIVAGLSLQFGWRVFILSAWGAGVIAISPVLKGYLYYGIDFSFHRANVVVPVLWVLIAHYVSLIRAPEMALYRAVTIIFAFLMVTGLYNHQLFMQTKSPNRHLAFSRWLTAQLEADKSARSRNHIVFWRTLWDPHYASINDVLRYFLPRTRGSWLENDCTLSKEYGPWPGDRLYVAVPSGVSYGKCQALSNFRLVPLGKFTFGEDTPLNLFRTVNSDPG